MTSKKMKGQPSPYLMVGGRRAEAIREKSQAFFFTPVSALIDSATSHSLLSPYPHLLSPFAGPPPPHK